ncbi:MAG: CRTAC1 family protein [Chloroflexi bacterium]|nr:CRTAC1 family protein [Chloroflexota bacterium]
MFVNQSALLLSNPTQLNYGIAITDVDGDGQFEAVVAGFGFPNLVLKWTGTGLENMAPSVIADRSRQAIGVGAADIDGDGHEELYLLNTDTFGGPKRLSDRLFDFDGDNWVDLFEVRMNQPVRNLIAGRSVVCVDRFGSGRYGFYVANYGGPTRLYELDEDGRLLDVARDAQINLTTGGRSALSLPLLSADRMDIFAANEHGANFLFRNRGDGTFVEVAESCGLADPDQHGRGVAVLDANDDGQLDLVYGNWEGPHRLYVRSSESQFTNIAPPEMQAPSRVRTVIAADFDNDGHEEVFFNNIGQSNRLFARREGAWQQVDVGEALEPYGLGTGAAVCDFDGDGWLELLVAHGESAMQPLSLYRVAPVDEHHFLRVLPLTMAGAPARGAVVRVQAGEREWIRVIDAGSGYLCQMEPVAHFGLGTWTLPVDRIDIQWPDGAQASLEQVDVDQMLPVLHPGA